MKNIDPKNKHSLKSKFILTLGVIALIPASWVIGKAMVNSSGIETVASKTEAPDTSVFAHAKPEVQQSTGETNSTDLSSSSSHTPTK